MEQKNVETVVDKETAKDVAGSIVRHALAGAGAVLITKGIIPESVWYDLSGNLATLVIGAGTYAFSQVWSFIKTLKK